MTVQNFDTLELLNMAACKLTGEYVEVNLQAPLEGTQGVCYSNPEGGYVIDLHPDVRFDAAKYMSVFLHECAHVKLHKALMDGADITGVYAWSDDPESLAATKREQEAGRLAQYWDGYAYCHAGEYPGIQHASKAAQDFQRKLTALLDLPEEVDGLYAAKVKAIYS